MLHVVSAMTTNCSHSLQVQKLSSFLGPLRFVTWGKGGGKIGPMTEKIFAQQPPVSLPRSFWAMGQDRCRLRGDGCVCVHR